MLGHRDDVSTTPDAARAREGNPRINHPRLPSDLGGSASTPPLTAYAVLVQQAFDAAQADTEPLSYLTSGGARPIQIDHALKILRRETIT
jgi:hypothetical protein